MGEILKDKVRVLIADLSVTDRNRLTELFHPFPEIELVGCVQNGTDALAMFQSLLPDVVVVSLAADVGFGRDLIRGIHVTRPSAVVIMHTRQASSPLRRLWLALGVDFFVDTDFELESVIGIVAAQRRDNRPFAIFNRG